MEPESRPAAAEEMPEPLRRDVRLLGALLGRVLEENGGPDLLADVERLRHATIRLREEPTEERRRSVLEVVDSFDLDREEAVARAFTVYFHLANLAEERHRVRTLQQRGRSAGPTRETIEAAVADIRERDGEAVLDDLVSRLSVTPVMTAHPTEARRRSVVDALERIAELVRLLDDPPPTAAQEAHLHRRILEEITNLWRTQQIRPKRPSPLDEVRGTLAVFDSTLFVLVPELYRELDRALGPEDVGARPARARTWLTWGSWVGGDRDGNPAVTADVTRAAAQIQSEHILHGLERAARRIARSVTATSDETPPTPELLASIERDAQALPGVAAAPDRIPDQVHRHGLELVAERLAATREGDEGRYAGPDELLADLRQLQDSLARAGAVRLAYGELQHLVWQAETFGFHLASLEVRQHSAVHARVVEEFLPGASQDAKLLDRLSAEGWPDEALRRAVDGSCSEEAREALDTFRAMSEIQRRLGPEACRRYVVSFTRTAADVVAVRALGALAVPNGPLNLDVVPLLEEAGDLRGATRLLDELLDLPWFGAWLDAAGRRVEVMLGYSDSTKEMGFLAANLTLYGVQAELARWAQSRDVDLTLFHGRGGALGRGGGPANRAILSQAAGSVASRFKVTEQGEVVFARYTNREIARRHLEQVAHAVLMASTPSHEKEVAAGQERWEGEARRMAEAAEAAYRDLLAQPGFPDFYAKVTPLEELEQMQLGSRPARRGGQRELPALRAIPWVFAWSQSRINLPGWYGLGAGLAAVAGDPEAPDPEGMARLRAMRTDWPFFRTILENAEMSLVKADLPIAELYLALGDRPDLSKRIVDEYRRTVKLVLAVRERERLLADHAVLRRAVELRNPYVDALSFLQVRLLERLRGGGLDPDLEVRLGRMVLLTVNGVAAGLQNTG
jgi:phosphoenolpyruvate carboxylase